MVLNLVFLIALKAFCGLNIAIPVIVSLISVIAPSLIEAINYIVFRKENIKRQKSFAKCINGFRASFYRAMISVMELPTKAYSALEAIVKTIYRKFVSHEHLLEWTTSEEAERQNKRDLRKRFMENVT